MHLQVHMGEVNKKINFNSKFYIQMGGVTTESPILANMSTSHHKKIGLMNVPWNLNQLFKESL